ncbi:UDP-N-acetyl-D-mannosamine dehydrogenase [Legionella septentrionalis]|uniref:UDP-N-acetyl-D-mannosamine dehydrogenase n=1 Tax=Legionella septentrionalis TaxID=2498109 RepID=A0A433JM60_9GAMM|nr:UDP-N-acetyl-D-mannosamine dehydrogenase [Legionella septentrionalis]RUQ91053.1 UDP-N-acetyl-D-mannosamine dehydrogenase [Legionella septentrionalis]RUR02878.1 UDP-N-acetyl-D-mannosamine dehydrogenase [Legionella septentrionalis]RUR11476.1 UDP-N-acetyl-D-mannosamine dehydrogenase [Legionella septentrionalis]
MLKKVCVVGLGYVGLPTAIMLADKGVDVHGYDINEQAVNKINQGIACIKETDLDALLEKVVKKGKLQAATSPVAADVFIIAVPTPILSDSSPDMRFVLNAATSIAPYLTMNNLVILESTSPVGSTKMLAEHLAKLRPDLDLSSDDPDVLMAYCPERIIPGNALAELVNNSRNIGGLTRKAALRARDVYGIFCQGELIVTDAETSELSKLVENSYRDVNIAFANELSLICERFGINVHELISLANKHPRVNILSPGIGVGGHCIPVDPWFIVHAAPEQAKLIHQARLTNDFKPKHIAQNLVQIANKKNATTVGILGLTYKPDVDDFRESPSLLIVEELAKYPLNIFVQDPYLDAYKGNLPVEVEKIYSAQAVIDKSEVLLIATPHMAYVECDFSKHIEGATLLDPAGFTYKHQHAKNMQEVV